ncbi:MULTISPECIES: type IV toxin-antitoxin system AbiEi family antitoxin domain-containing protein [Microbacterium]|uniref:type IV toxin-antitoxin system AbiEi family antitoxin domain-containing protein n=1 Tax=Microbacterium TaxID=33882 RepID=UPI001EF5A15B|nr:type IV toxin-antitoxin system AbiEi family antitoxin domain-containing protein [Microbacterium sp. KCTC 39802]
MLAPTPLHLASTVLSATFVSPTELARRGLSREATRSLVRTGRLLRLRNGRYALPGIHPALLQAGRLGGRLDCVSLLHTLGVFVHTHDRLHVQIDMGASRLPPRSHAVVAHWRATSRERGTLAADLIEALAQACRCQSLRNAIATLDSAWHLGLVDEAGIAAVFELLPRRYRRLRRLLDPRSESGPETIMRLMLRGLGCHIEVQVKIAGVGRVDFVVDGWLIVECDSRAHHEGWASQKHDRRRDLAAAALGYTTIRPIAEDILYRREEVLTALRSTLSRPAPRGAVQNSFDPLAWDLVSRDSPGVGPDRRSSADDRPAADWRQSGG